MTAGAKSKVPRVHNLTPGAESARGLRDQPEALGRGGFDGFPCERHGVVPACGPLLDQIAVVRTLRVAGFAWNVGHYGTVPIAHVENLPERGAGGLLKCRTAGG